MASESAGKIATGIRGGLGACGDRTSLRHDGEGECLGIILEALFGICGSAEIGRWMIAAGLTPWYGTPPVMDPKRVAKRRFQLSAKNLPNDM